MALPDLNNCDFFKKATLFSGEKNEKVFIFKLRLDAQYTFFFTCPKCGDKNEFKGELNMKEVKAGGKKKGYITFKCKKCATEFMIEKFKVRKPGKGGQ